MSRPISRRQRQEAAEREAEAFAGADCAAKDAELARSWSRACPGHHRQGSLPAVAEEVK